MSSKNEVLLENARNVVRKLKFGTIEWDIAMEEVRKLVDIVNDRRERFSYTSIDGDIFAPRPSIITGKW